MGPLQRVQCCLELPSVAQGWSGGVRVCSLVSTGVAAVGAATVAHTLHNHTREKKASDSHDSSSDAGLRGAALAALSCWVNAGYR